MKFVTFSILICNCFCFQSPFSRVKRNFCMIKSREKSDVSRRKQPTKFKVDPTWKPISTQWRIFNIEILLSLDPGKDVLTLHPCLVDAVARKLSINEKDMALLAEKEWLCIVRKSFDSRDRTIRTKGEPLFVYTVDVDLGVDVSQKIRIKPEEGKIEPISTFGKDQDHLKHYEAPVPLRQKSMLSVDPESIHKASVIVVGTGPAGLFAAIRLAEAGLKPLIIERGQPVERRGKDIGALFHRGNLDGDSNLCFGEGGAGTWSDGKLTTRIGKNSGPVRRVLETLVAHGAPARILVDGKPHLGTDKLVLILRGLRQRLESLGATFLFGQCVDRFLTETGGEGGVRVAGVRLVGGHEIRSEVVVVGTGHSSRIMYSALAATGVKMVPKAFAVGFRVEHPQELINRIQLGNFSTLVESGRGKVPVADYRLAAQVRSDKGKEGGEGGERGVYSFCMCPGGQIVPTSVDPTELCLNGMSFSRRQSKWANSALVVTISPEDCAAYFNESGQSLDPLIGLRWQQEMERRAAVLGGGGLVAPVQRVTDFLAGKSEPSDPAAFPSSSYRLGVRPSPCHEIYPDFITSALREALLQFDRELPGFVCPEGVLHGIETRTSAPIQVLRDKETLECQSVANLYPIGEGAGHAGGIVSAAVDGDLAGQIVAARLLKSQYLESSKETAV